MLLLAVTTGQLTAQPLIFPFGETSFHYEQVWGPLEGDFHAEGAIDTTGEMLSGVIGFEYPDSSTTFVHLAVTAHPDTTFDLFGFYINTDDELEPGEYPVSTTNLFFFILGADSLVIPENPDSLDIGDLLNLVQADYTFISATGNITLVTVTEEVRGGTFVGTALDVNQQPPVLIELDQGDFYLTALPESVVRFTHPSTLQLSCYPNPFNPGTTVSLTLEQSALVDLEVFNLQGQLVRQLHQGWLAAGQHRFLFEPAALPSGTYLVRAFTPDDRISQRVQYLK